MTQHSEDTWAFALSRHQLINHGWHGLGEHSSSC
jgi:hypothetical protein